MGGGTRNKMRALYKHTKWCLHHIPITVIAHRRNIVYVHDVTSGSMYPGDILEISIVEINICQGLSADKVTPDSPPVLLFCSDAISRDSKEVQPKIHQSSKDKRTEQMGKIRKRNFFACWFTSVLELILSSVLKSWHKCKPRGLE